MSPGHLPDLAAGGEGWPELRHLPDGSRKREIRNICSSANALPTCLAYFQSPSIGAKVNSDRLGIVDAVN